MRGERGGSEYLYLVLLEVDPEAVLEPGAEAGARGGSSNKRTAALYLYFFLHHRETVLTLYLLSPLTSSLTGMDSLPSAQQALSMACVLVPYWYTHTWSRN